MRLKNRTSLVTGASRGIGRAIALTLAKEGSDVIVNYAKNTDKARDTVDEILRMGRNALAIQADVADKNQVSTMVTQAVERFGKIDILVNNAGVLWRTGSILEASAKEWETVLGINLLGTYHCAQAVAPHMIKQKYGKMINISSIGGIPNRHAGLVAYAISKAAVINLTKKLAYELGPDNINVNAIAPSLVKTELLSSLVESEEELKKLFEDRKSIISLRRIGEPQDIANVALFLASDESSYITGQIIVVDGGRFDYMSHSV